MQIRSVTSGKGLALRAGPVGLGYEAGLELAGAGRDCKVDLWQLLSGGLHLWEFLSCLMGP